MWSTDQESRGTRIIFGGNERSVSPGTNLAEAVRSAANEAGYQKFRVYINGTEIKPENAPATVVEGDTIKVTPYDVAG